MRLVQSVTLSLSRRGGAEVTFCTIRHPHPQTFLASKELSSCLNKHSNKHKQINNQITKTT